MLSTRISFMFLCLLLLIHVSHSINLTVFQQEALIQHNFRRQQHCVPQMTLNSTLNNIAQNYAIFLANNGLFNHSGASGLGENLWAMSSSVALGNINGSQAVESWYSEISAYNFSSPGFSSGTGHFTQVVWQNSIQLGVGIAYNGPMTRAVVVANYLPPGNVLGSFVTNVFPVCVNGSSTIPPSTTTTAGSSNSTGSPSNSSGPTNLGIFQQEALIQHNFRRQQHCVPQMTLNSTLNNIAQNYAIFLANNGIFNHSGASGLGENLWAISTSGTLGVINGSRAVESWYSEISAYNFSSPGFSSGTGHFTQVVWQNSIQLGVGIAYNGPMTRAVVVANYAPQGNIIGSFSNNVPAVCTTTNTNSNANNSALAVGPIHFSIMGASMTTCIWWFNIWRRY